VDPNDDKIMVMPHEFEASGAALPDETKFEAHVSVTLKRKLAWSMHRARRSCAARPDPLLQARQRLRQKRLGNRHIQQGAVL
jgi:hypothetical protein